MVKSSIRSRSSIRLLANISLMVLMQLQVCQAYNKNNVLVDYNDLIKLFKNTEPDTEVLSMELTSFPYIANVSK